MLRKKLAFQNPNVACVSCVYLLLKWVKFTLKIDFCRKTKTNLTNFSNFHIMRSRRTTCWTSLLNLTKMEKMVKHATFWMVFAGKDSSQIVLFPLVELYRNVSKLCRRSRSHHFNDYGRNNVLVRCISSYIEM